MTRARETSQLQAATNYDAVSGADEFAVIDPPLPPAPPPPGPTTNISASSTPPVITKVPGDINVWYT